jgi:hypothetical protein
MYSYFLIVINVFERPLVLFWGYVFRYNYFSSSNYLYPLWFKTTFTFFFFTNLFLFIWKSIYNFCHLFFCLVVFDFEKRIRSTKMIDRVYRCSNSFMFSWNGQWISMISWSFFFCNFAYLFLQCHNYNQTCLFRQPLLRFPGYLRQAPSEK